MSVYFLSEDDRRIFREMADEFRSRKALTGTKQGVNPIATDEWMAPETYVAITPEDGIPGATDSLGTGTGSGSGTIFGEGRLLLNWAECRLFAPTVSGSDRILREISLKKQIHNLSYDPIPGNSLIAVTRDKFGRWYCVTEGYPKAPTLGFITINSVNLQPTIFDLVPPWYYVTNEFTLTPGTWIVTANLLVNMFLGSTNSSFDGASGVGIGAQLYNLTDSDYISGANGASYTYPSGGTVGAGSHNMDHTLFQNPSSFNNSWVFGIDAPKTFKIRVSGHINGTAANITVGVLTVGGAYALAAKISPLQPDYFSV